MRRLVIFAHYDSLNRIEKYVEIYLKELFKNNAKIIFVSDSELPLIEQKKITDYTEKIIAKHHGEYDFGSYKIGFKYCLDSQILKEFDELIFVNDSCYAPLAPFEKMFSAMDSKNIDFWGITANKTKKANNIPHIQSFFLAFRKNVFMSEYFKKFVLSFSKLNTKEDIINEYECGITKKLVQFGYKWGVYCTTSIICPDSYMYDYKNLIKQGMPLLKRSIPLKRARMPIFRLESFVNSTGYNFEYIQEDIDNNKSELHFRDKLVILYKLFWKIPYMKVKYLLCSLLQR